MLKFDAELVWLSDRYQTLFGQFGPRYDHVLMELVNPVIEAIAKGDAPYHTLDHTWQVVKVGQAILTGKQHHEGVVSPIDWLQFMLSLFCHDIGYVKGILGRDNGDRHCYFDGRSGWIKISPTATGAALQDCHVDRSKAYVATLALPPQIELKSLQMTIEMTRFPIPHGAVYQDKLSYGGLCRAADLLGQLSDPLYLQKLPALFREFEEVGMNRVLGYATPKDLQTAYPYFFWQVVYPYVKESMRYLSATDDGRQLIARLYTNLCLAELGQPRCDVTHTDLQDLKDESALLSWQEAGFTFS